MDPWKEVELVANKIIKNNRYMRVLDIGTGFCNSLRILSNLKDSELYSLDPELKALKSAKEEFRNLILIGQLFLFRAMAENLPFKDGSFDFVISLMVLHHMENPAKAIEEILRILKKEGKLLLVDWKPSAGGLFNPHSREELKLKMEMTLANFRKKFRYVEKDYWYALIKQG